jgi:hypothetical protein
MKYWLMEIAEEQLYVVPRQNRLHDVSYWGLQSGLAIDKLPKAYHDTIAFLSPEFNIRNAFGVKWFGPCEPVD